ncbi:MAG: 4Fe-4S dicluster domain-containing protein [Oscillospiraceae bacterium]|nr:4Fe-4S dicluster domain-containing protein [Oscillospiraceae bacterium]
MKFGKTVVKNLFHKPATKGYPFIKNEFFERTRGHIVMRIEDCIFCGTCARRCPASAIQVDRDAKKWSIERFRCVQCGNCVENCPKKCLGMDRHYAEVKQSKEAETFYGATLEQTASDHVEVPHA